MSSEIQRLDLMIETSQKTIERALSADGAAEAEARLRAEAEKLEQHYENTVDLTRAAMNVADAFGEIFAPHTICKKGCNYCCHVDVRISREEAQIISEHTGVNYDDSQEALSKRHEHYGKPCSFLTEEGCSIYEARPLACRLHFSLLDTPTMCDTRIVDSHVKLTGLDTEWLWTTLRSKGAGSPVKDIRKFFPKPQKTG